MRDESTLDWLREMTFFLDFPSGDLERLAPLLRVEKFSAGQTVFREGDEARDIYFVVEGRVAVQHDVPGLGPRTLASVTSGHPFGWSAFVAPHVETATARASTPVSALAIDGQALRRLVAEDPVFGCRLSMRLNELLSSRIRAHALQLQDLYATPGVLRRVAGG